MNSYSLIKKSSFNPSIFINFTLFFFCFVITIPYCLGIEDPKLQVFYPLVKVRERKGILVIFHGLNLKPEKMDSLSLIFQKDGYLIIRPKFKGHLLKGEGMGHLQNGDWGKEALFFLEKSLDISKKENLPISFLGYSMGALFFIEAYSKLFMNQRKMFKKAIFIAPAIATRFYTKLVKLFYAFGDDFVLKSHNPEEYRVNNGTSMLGYRMIFKGIEEIQKLKAESIISNALLILHPRDELISVSGVKEFIQEKKLKNWKMMLFEKKGFGPNHLIIDEKTVGKDFYKLIEKIKKFL